MSVYHFLQISSLGHFDFGEFSKLDWVREQRSDKAMSRILDLLEFGHRLTKRLVGKETDTVRKLHREWDKFVLRDGILYRKYNLYNETILQLVLPSVYKDTVLRSLHDDIGHQGRDRTLSLVKSRYFWPDFGCR